MRKLYWYLTGFAKKHGLVFIISIVIATLFFSFIIPSISDNLETKTKQYVGLIGNYNLDDLPLEITNKLSAGLTVINEDGSVSPHLAQRWNIEQDGKTYRFILKDNIYWQDGKKLKPQDIEYNFEGIETIITPNDIVFKLPDLYAPFPGVVSKPILKKNTIRKNFFFHKPILVGLGEYKMIDYKTKGKRVTEVTLDGQDTRYIYRFYLTEDMAVTAFKQGEIDILANISKDHDIIGWHNVNLKSTLATDKYLAVFFNIRNSLFTKNIRQALSYAVAKPKDNTRAIGPINPKSWAYLPAGKAYDQDIDRAVGRLLDELPREEMELELTTTSIYEQEAEKIKQEWQTLGEKAYQECQESKKIKDKNLCENVKITTHIKVTNFPDTNDFEVMLIGQKSRPDPDQYYLWHSNTGTNFSGYKNTRIDNLLEKGRQATNQKERKEIYQEFQQFFLEDAPAIFIKYLYFYEVKRK